MQGTEYWKDRPLDDPERDWGAKVRKSNWVEDYLASKTHPHRRLIIEALKTFEWESLLEVGANCGPNLDLINDHFRDKRLVGIDANRDAVAFAQRAVVRPNVSVVEGDLRTLPYDSESFDAVLSDATLLYVEPRDIVPTLQEMNRVCKKAIILVERYSKDRLGAEVGHVWGRDYETLLKELDYKVESKKITKTQWPTSSNWQKHGRFYLALKS